MYSSLRRIDIEGLSDTHGHIGPLQPPDILSELFFAEMHHGIYRNIMPESKQDHSGIALLQLPVTAASSLGSYQKDLSLPEPGFSLPESIEVGGISIQGYTVPQISEL